ncbi:hypothetical protein EVAR_44972_1 [Eumeta japonica]|uniref:Uncharacterized protein n=1 Tax=Eumeta variegata TaxID=151549 RepID=A0A4C1W6F9_EUMVA|nr:hypothetical protein EVAR_44972_1 [Eumeta japonica]
MYAPAQTRKRQSAGAYRTRATSLPRSKTWAPDRLETIRKLICTNYASACYDVALIIVLRYVEVVHLISIAQRTPDGVLFEKLDYYDRPTIEGYALPVHPVDVNKRNQVSV